MFGLPAIKVLALSCAALAAVGVGAYVKGRYDGRAISEARYLAAEAKASEAARKTEANAAAISLNVSMDYRDALQEIVIVRQIVTREVTRYVTEKADAACTVPAGAVRLHDAAASGNLPGIPSGAAGVDDSSGIPLSTVVGIVAGNYGSCRETAARLTALQVWVRRQAESRAAE